MKRKSNNILILLLIFVYLLGACTSEKSNKLSSPDQSLVLQLYSEGSSLSYRLYLKNSLIIENGNWGVDTDKGILFNSDKVEIKESTNVSRTLNLRNGQQANVQFNEYEIIFSEDYKIELRLFNNAFAYRYVSENDDKWHINSELSSWRISNNPKAWYFERKNAWKLKSYAGEWISCETNQLDTISPTGSVQGTPIMFDFGDEVYGFLTEASLYNYSGMRLQASEGGRLTANFTEEDGFDINGKLISPWRVLYIGEGLTQLVNQQVINALNPDPDPKLFEDKSYIKPGKSAWRWWSKRIGTPSQEQDIIDFASQLSFEYSIIDEGWERWDDTWNTIKKITKHAAEQNVKVFLWKHSKELNFPENDYQLMKEWLDKLKDSGAVGAKVDFMNSESKSLIDFDIKLLEEAAKRQLLINFHGCQKPSGESYSYPNEVTREGIRGLELNGMAEGPITAAHNAALPFTRFVVGEGDYTPLGFSNPGNTTWTHQLATLVCFTSYLQVIAEDPEFLLKDNRVEPALDIIKSVPADWEKTIVLPGSKIGEIAAMARKKGDDWYVGVLNTSVKSLDICFSFLDDNAKYDAYIVQDLPKNQRGKKMFDSEKIEITKYTTESYQLEENGGLVIKLVKK